jgi:hypothetical protein
MNRLLLISIFLLFLITPSFAQESEEKAILKPSLSIGLLNGGQATTTKFYFKSGFGAYVSIGLKQDNSWISPIFHIGVEKIDTETLLPIGLEYNIRFKPTQNSGFMSFSGGYAFAFNPEFEDIDGYEYKGGLFFNPGWGYIWKLNNKSEFLTSVRYRHQFLSAEFYKQGIEKYTETFQYMFLQLTAGINF